jgi:uncharacterized protein (DUF1499 family)
MRRLVVELPPSRAAMWSRRLALFALAVVAIAVVLARLGRIEPAATLAVMGSGLLLAIAAAVLAVGAFGIVWADGRAGFGAALLGLLVSLALVAWPAFLGVQAFRLPRLNDVSTDTADPPSFSRSRRALEIRAGRTPPEIAPESRAAQRAAYPEAGPLVLELSPQETYALVLKAAARRGWQIIESNQPGGRTGVGRLEAVDHSLLLRFPDDITVRIRPLAGGTRVDVRSSSRLGAHDFGANARRIEAFGATLMELAEAEE